MFKKFASVFLGCSLLVSPVKSYFEFRFLAPDHGVRRVLRIVVGVGLSAYCAERGFEAIRLFRSYVNGRSKGLANGKKFWKGFEFFIKSIASFIAAKKVFKSVSGS